MNERAGSGVSFLEWAYWWMGGRCCRSSFMILSVFCPFYRSVRERNCCCGFPRLHWEAMGKRRCDGGSEVRLYVQEKLCQSQRRELDMPKSSSGSLSNKGPA